ncbi:hypothetical protein [[Eubacterium] cellulosolvens]
MDIDDLMNIIREEFENLTDGGRLLLSVSCRHVLKTNILLLQFLLNEKNYDGVYICVDIPHIHIQRLLKKYNIKSDCLKYIDAITGLSTVEREFDEKITYVDNPFDVRSINQAIRKVQVDGVKRFVILDNMATLQFYSTEITNFFEHFIASIEDINLSYLMLAVDKNRHKETYKIIKNYCDRELEIKKEWIETVSRFQ